MFSYYLYNTEFERKPLERCLEMNNMIAYFYSVHGWIFCQNKTLAPMLSSLVYPITWKTFLYLHYTHAFSC